MIVRDYEAVTANGKSVQINIRSIIPKDNILEHYLESKQKPL